MALVKAITKHGNSAGIILQQTILKIIGWEVGTEVEIQYPVSRSCWRATSGHPTTDARPTESQRALNKAK